MKPKRIILVRHGESEGNVDKTIYSVKPDYAVVLTEKGKQQAYEAGVAIDKLIGDGKFCCYYSPYYRARQTMDMALRGISNGQKPTFVREEPRLREQEWSGKLRTQMEHTEAERDAYGPFFFRLDGGESCADVYDRVSDFLSTMARDFEKQDFPETAIVFGHGMLNRLFLMRWFHIPVADFEVIANPKNGSLFILELQDTGKYKLTSELKKYDRPYHDFRYEAP